MEVFMKKFNIMVWISVVLLGVLFLYGACARAEKTETTEAQSAQTAVELSDQEIDDIVRRSYQYVAMYNVIQKNAMLYAKMTGTGGWNVNVPDTQLKDHNFKTIARPNNDTLYSACMLDLRNDPVIVH